MNNSSVLAVIPARGKSKSIKKKNIVQLGGKPLIAYTVEALLGIEHEVDHIVSTDDEEIKNIAMEYGGKVPFMRPAELAKDKTNIIDVLFDILGKAGKMYEYVLLLQPTAPLRQSFDIDAALNLAFASGADSVCSFMRVESYHPSYMYYERGGSLEQVIPTEPGKPRQEFEKVLWRNGAIYMVRTSRLLGERLFITGDCVPYLMPPERSINVDSYDDLRLAEYYLKSARLKDEKSKLRIKALSV